jgi:hypothetical protein
MQHFYPAFAKLGKLRHEHKSLDGDFGALIRAQPCPMENHFDLVEFP